MKKLDYLMSKVKGLFPYADKVAHFVIGIIIALVFWLIAGHPQWGFAAAFIVGLIKERRDDQKWGSGGVSAWTDWFATIAGGALPWIIYELVK